MKNLLLYISLLFPMFVFSQNEQLAQNYFDRGEFDKATLIYENLAKNHPNNYNYFQKQVACYQQLKQFDKAETIIKSRIDKTRQPNLYIELGYNYQLQKNTDKADKNYKIALEKIKENPNNVYNVARDFEQKVLVEQALEAYRLGALGNPDANFDYQVSLLQGQLGKIDLMIDTLVDYSFKFPSNLPLVQNQLTRFMSEDSQKTFSDSLKKALLIRTQKTQDIFWNQFMSWFFVQQKDYGKAFIQEKAIFKRNPDNLLNIINLAKLTIDDKEIETATEILNFILQNTQDLELQMEAHYQLISIDIDKATAKEYPIIKEKLDLLLKKYGISPYSIRLQILSAHFDAFYLKQFESAKTILTKALDLPLNSYQKADVKMELAGILLLNEKFNQAIIYYAQIQDDLENDQMAHEASLKMAKASYYKGDFDWAQKQFTVLKSSTSQLIANDSMELFLLISDNTVEDSTQVALKKFSKADFLAYQNKNTEALQSFETILAQHKGQKIEDVTLLRIGRLYEKQNNFQQALNYYQQIIDKHAEGIYIDEALFFSAEIYRKQLPDIAKAKAYYEKIIFGHEDSIYFVEARNNYRKLRGDTNL
ncbi:Tetratricopeptide repeat-containing protein [Flavobacterium swingsii]|uniref:Tetratricopeptide repeat-containing protein n=1 Tax=Flavobacterium swingsii TaxID=498292 RepID=A0A1I0XE01_9FLAO|nr:tetratricopeptide repeat protein [Flavobacterium swingsii]SFA99114.1 Tetratricopeptide repeat-containing protein [Flavobacterium swingsii]